MIHQDIAHNPDDNIAELIGIQAGNMLYDLLQNMGKRCLKLTVPPADFSTACL